MIDLSGITHHPAIEEIVEVLCNKTQNTDKGFYRVEVAYFLGKLASNMRATIVTKDRGDIPANIYALALASSGYGKGYSIALMENEFMGGFQRRFIEDTLPVIADQNHWKMATDRAVRNASEVQEEYDKIVKEYKSIGAFAYTFDSGSIPAVKQLRHKLLLANCGAVSLQIDEIGMNLVGQTEVLTVFLELYDQGMVKQKLTKNNHDNQRSEELIGKSPTNMLLFGAPSRLFDGAQTEQQFYTMLETGYARRCLFAHGKEANQAAYSQSPEEMYEHLISPENDNIISKWSTHFHSMADPSMWGWKTIVETPVAIELLRYKKLCQIYADELPIYAPNVEIHKSEVRHRYFKALKLAGTLAFIDCSSEVEMTHLHQAIKLVEESGELFSTILRRDKPYAKLAQYIAGCNEEVTETDLMAVLPFYKSGNASNRKDLMQLAVTWGYKNNIIIKKSYGPNDIVFFTGETLKATDAGDMIFSFSDNWAYNYASDPNPVAFDQLHCLTQAPGMQWANHLFKDGHRTDENVIPGFNMLILDVDGGVSIELVHDLLKEIRFLTYTTKRHTPEENRFRLIIPINYILKLNKEEYGELVNDVISWLPFKTSGVDDASSQRSKSWMTHEAGTYHYNLEAPLMDILPFIPRTSSNELHRKEQKEIQNMDNLERWFHQRMDKGNRNNQMLKYALALVDSGIGLLEVNRMVHAFNKKLKEPMEESRIDSTILVTVAKRFSKAA